MSFRGSGGPLTTSTLTMSPPGEIDGDVTVVDSITVPAPAGPSQAARKTDVDAGVTAAEAYAAAQAAAALATAAAHADAGDAATATNALTNASALFHGLLKGGKDTITTNGAGDATIAHGLGAIPSAISLTPRTTGASCNWHPVVENYDGVNINVRIYNTNTGGVQAGGTFEIFWLVLA